MNARPLPTGGSISRLNEEYLNQPTERVLQFVLNDGGFGKTAIVSSFGTDSAVLLHLVATIAPKTPVLFIDTGKLFLQTLQYRTELAAKLRLTNIKSIRPEPIAIGTNDPNGDLWLHDNNACCRLRKITPFKLAIAEYDTWISGRKSYQGEQRKNLKLFERSEQHIKVNPLAMWDRKAISDYMALHALPRHPLTDHGYSSVGCSPCTSPACLDEDTRAGRWRGSGKTECGIHIVGGDILRHRSTR